MMKFCQYKHRRGIRSILYRVDRKTYKMFIIIKKYVYPEGVQKANNFYIVKTIVEFIGSPNIHK